MAERKDVLSGVLFMLTLWFYARYAERPASWGRYLLVIGSFALGLTAKPMLVTLPYVLLLLDYWPLGRFGAPGRSDTPCLTPRSSGTGCLTHGEGLLAAFCTRPRNHQDEANPRRPSRLLARLLVEKIPLFVLAAVSCVATLAAQRDAIRLWGQLGFSRRVANAVVAYVAYLGKMLCPAGLAVLYPFPKNQPPALHVVAAVAVLVVISTVVFAARRKWPYLIFGWLWYLGTLVPVIGLVQVGNQAMADRYTYLTQIGLTVAITWGAARMAGSSRCRPWAVAAVSAPVAAALIVCAWQQTRHWHDSETLWTHALACIPQNPVAHNNLGSEFTRRGRFDEAIAHYGKALELNPDYAEAYHNLGFVLARRGQVDQAIACYRKVLAIDPDHVEAHYNLGLALAGRGQVDEAIAHYRRALEINPEYVPAHNNLGSALASRGQVDEAIVQYRKALEIKPDHVEAHNNLGNALAGRGQFDEAIAHYRKAVEIKPDFMMAHYNLGIMLAGRGQFDEAIAHYRKALEVKADFAEAHFNLGIALAGRGQVGEAIEHYQKALALASARNDTALADAIRARIRLYQPAAPAGRAP